MLRAPERPREGITPAQLQAIMDSITSLQNLENTNYNNIVSIQNSMTGYVTKTTTVNGHSLSSNVIVAYSDLTGQPTIPAAQVPVDWNSSSGVTAIANKPTIPAAQVASDWSAASGVSAILNKPSIPAAQVQSDWNASTGLGAILNKPASLAPVTSALTLAFVGTGATGTQISATRPSMVSVSVSLSATASISGAATSLATAKKCATNSATESDWTAIGAENDQSYALAVAISGTNKSIQQINVQLPAGWFFKMENSGTGTHAEQIISSEKTIYG